MKRKIKNYCSSLLKTRWITIILPLFILGVFFLLLTFNNVYTEIYDIERFNRSKETIRSPITIENEQDTKIKMRETVQSVEDRYEIYVEITEERVEYIEEIFDAILKIDEEHSKNITQVSLSMEEKLQRLKQILSSEIIEAVNENALAKLLELSPEMRKEGKDVFIQSLKKVLNEGVRIEGVQSAYANMQQDIKYTNLDIELIEALTELSKFAVVENAFFDTESTLIARKEAESSVEPVVIRAGEILVREGQTITNELYEELKLVGLLNKERNLYPIIGLIILIGLVISVIGYEMNLIAAQNKLDKGKIISILLISIIVISLMKIISLYTTEANQLFFVVPVATGVLLVKQLIDERLAIVLATLYAILGSIIFNGEIAGSLNMEAGIYFLFSQLAAIIFLANIKDRLAIIKSGIGMAIVNMITVLLFVFLSFEKYALSDLFTQFGFGVAAALLSAVLTIGLLPFFETSLGILSDIKLLSLSNPNQPLLRKLLIEAPGTYHHSIMVANLSEAACEAIGANGLLARVGAYYHDIGKTIHPHYFIENQLSIKNPHDELKPKESAEIIISHPYDGAALLKKYHLPREIIDISEQHHGTTLLKYFFYKEKEYNEDVNEADYRYPGPKPQTKEAAIISVCDSVEAAVRSLKEPTKEKIDEIVSSIVDDRLMDGQLDESPLTLQELKNVRATICETLKGFYHSRIEYPLKEAE